MPSSNSDGIIMTACAGMNDQAPWSAFYNDPQLADFLLNRWRWHAKAGHIKLARRPFWRQGKGTSSAALVHSDNPQIFERLTGMPYSIGLILELIGFLSEPEQTELAVALRPGIDTSNVAMHVVREWFLAEENQWADLLDDAQVDQLRLDWGTACEQWLAGESTINWHELEQRAAALMQPGNAMREVQNNLLKLFQTMSPPPQTNDVEAWLTLTVVGGIHSKFMVAQFRAGWTTSDFAKEMELFQWFTERELREPGGKFNAASLRRAQREWEQLPKDKEYIAKEEHFFKHSEQAFKPINAHLRKLLTKALNHAPRSSGVISG